MAVQRVKRTVESSWAVWGPLTRSLILPHVLGYVLGKLLKFSACFLNCEMGMQGTLRKMASINGSQGTGTTILDSGQSALHSWYLRAFPFMWCVLLGI